MLLVPALASAQIPQAASAVGLRIVVISGEDAVNIIQQKTAVNPIVEVRDRNDLPVSGVAVTFNVGGGGGAIVRRRRIDADGHDQCGRPGRGHRADADGHRRGQHQRDGRRQWPDDRGDDHADQLRHGGRSGAVRAAQRRRRRCERRRQRAAPRAAAVAASAACRATTLGIVGGGIAAAGALVATQAGGGGELPCRIDRNVRQHRHRNRGRANYTGTPPTPAPAAPTSQTFNGPFSENVAFMWTSTFEGSQFQTCNATYTRTGTLRFVLTTQSSGTVTGTGQMVSFVTNVDLHQVLGRNDHPVARRRRKMPAPARWFKSPARPAVSVSRKTSNLTDTSAGIAVNIKGTTTFTGSLSGGAVTGTLAEVFALTYDGQGMSTRGNWSSTSQVTAR